MKIKDSIKKLDRGISKIIPPEQTCKVVLRKIQTGSRQILRSYFEVKRASSIPQYMVMGTDFYQQFVRYQGSHGKGPFKEQALASGIMELVERYSCYKHLLNKDSIKIYSSNALKNNFFQWKDLFANFTDDTQVRVLEDNDLENAKIRWYEGAMLNGKKVYLPLGLIEFLLEGSNGMAVGNSFEEALLQAICEVIERHCVTLIMINRVETPLIDISTINYPVAKELIKKFQALKNEIFIKDFSLGIGLPVIGVVRKINRTDCMITAGAATTPEEALIRALTENSQTDVKKNLITAYMARHYLVSSKIISMGNVSSIENDNIKLELKAIEEILKKQNMRLFFCDATDKALNIPSVIVYIAGAKFLPPREDMAHRNVLMGLVEEFLRVGNYGEVKRYLKKANKIDKKNHLIYLYYKGLILRLNFKYSQAIACLLKITRAAFPEQLKGEKSKLKEFCLAELGICYQALNDIDKAIDFYLKVIDLYPRFIPFSYSNIGSLSNDKNLFKSAKRLYQNIRMLRINFPRMGAEKFKNIFYSYQKDRENVLARFQKAQAYFKNKKYEKAIRAARKIIKLSHVAGKIHNVHLLLGFCYGRNKEYEKAIPELKKAKKVNPKDPRICFALSNCYRNIGQADQADKELEEGVLKKNRDRSLYLA